MGIGMGQSNTGSSSNACLAPAEGKCVTRLFLRKAFKKSTAKELRDQGGIESWKFWRIH